jgi:hypothetical protein
MLERIRWRLASVFASWALRLMRPETSEDGFSIALTNAEKQAQWREGREQRSRALEQKVVEQQAELERLRSQPIRRSGNRPELQIDPQTLSIGAREKLAAAIRQEKTKLHAQFDRAVQAEIARAIDETVLPQYNKEMADARQVIEPRKGVMSREEYLFTSCLHPDRSASKERLNEAFNAFIRHELVMCSEKEMPTAASAIPRNCEEMMKRRGR